ncbi:MAG: GNAT family N-acetyltransferase [Flavobacteriaceae bacterium]
MIRKATLEDVARMKIITEACAQHMIAQGIYQWNENYPSREIFEKDVKKETVYVYVKQGVVTACVVFSFEKDTFYSTVDWLTQDKKQLYVHRLAVHPDAQGKGIARKLMAYGEAYAKANACLSVRLDTFSLNPRNNRFYKARNYIAVGEIFFKHKSPHPFYCYEKILV